MDEIIEILVAAGLILAAYVITALMMGVFGGIAFFAFKWTTGT